MPVHFPVVEVVEGDIGGKHYEFMKGRQHTGYMYVLRQMAQNRLEVYDSIALVFVDLEKTVETVPR